MLDEDRDARSLFHSQGRHDLPAARRADRLDSLGSAGDGDHNRRGSKVAGDKRRADIAGGAEERVAEPLEEVIVDLAPDAGTAEWIGHRGIERNPDAVRPDQPRPLDLGPFLPWATSAS